MNLLSASSKLEQMEAKCAFIHPRPIMNCRLPSLPELSLTVPELLLCKQKDSTGMRVCLAGVDFILGLFLSLYHSLTLNR